MIEAASYGTYAPKGIVRVAVDWTRSLPDNWLGRRAAIIVRRFALRRLSGQPVDIEALGIRMRLRPANNICEKRMLFTPRSFDPEELGLLAASIRYDFTFVDLGANVGVYSLFVASRAGPSARILAVEPIPEIFERLTYNIGINPSATVKAVECAVAEKTGDVTLFVDPQNTGESSVKVVGSSGARPIRVAARTLIELLAAEGYERVDAMKIDVEGAEDLILEPFLAAAPPSLLPRLLILENGSKRWQTDLVRSLEARDYRLVAKTRLNLVLKRENGADHG